ncbi:MAG: tetratricopeptide repeat protein [Gemmatimonadota bacterium]|nr:tetratricopeptide repeat protein [Gemmatimonadota bacterium]
MRSRLRTIVLLALLPFAPPALRAQEDANRAWDAGDVETAWRLYSARLAEDSSDVRALHRLGLIAAWAGRYDQSLALFDRLLRLAPANREAVVDRARVRAWQGHTADAVRALDTLLAAAPDYLPALEARAQFLGWAGEYRSAVATYERLGEILPENRSIQSSRAQILSWAARLEESIALYDSLVRSDPTDLATRRALGQVLGWAGRLDSSAVVYGGLLAADSTDLDAWAGLARTRSWRGRLKAAEVTWRRVLALDSGNVPALVGLGQTLRWQGRDAASRAVLARARRLAPNDPDVRTQWRWTDVAFRPRTGASFTYESDSDDNGIGTLAARASWRAAPRLDLRVHGYWRWLEQRGATGFTQEAHGGMLELALLVEPGWTLTAGAGASGSDVPGAETHVRFAARLATPAREPVVATVSVTGEPLDATAQLVRTGVTVRQGALDVRAAPAGGWTLTGAVSAARFDGTEANTRVAGAAGVSRRFRRAWNVGAAVRVFGFSKDLSDGYFDPDLYAVLEVPLRWEREIRWLTPVLEAAPGLQQVGSDGNVSAVARVRGELQLTVAPGRYFAIAGGYSTLGMALFASDVGDYRYGYLTVGGGWRF